MDSQILNAGKERSWDCDRSGVNWTGTAGAVSGSVNEDIVLLMGCNNPRCLLARRSRSWGHMRSNQSIIVWDVAITALLCIMIMYLLNGRRIGGEIVKLLKLSTLELELGCFQP